ncbi:MAG: replicative DNA helicase [Rickettsiales bacterium]|jgi:replicative DNA helicase|nr:replicative DNA helicase [Rickettsiales bacterium]
MDFSPKTLPTNLEAEQAILAAVLMNNRALERVSEFLKPEHFTHPAHQEIYKLAEKQFAAGIPFDIITAKNYLTQQGVLESVGGVDYLSQLAGAGATVVNVDQYGRIVYENALRRELINLGQEITDSAFVEDLENPVGRQIETAEQKLFQLSVAGSTEKEGASLAAALRGALEEIEIAYKADGKLSGLTTGFADLDKAISGLHHSDLVIIAGRPGMGKTALAVNIAFNAANAIRFGNANKNYKGAVVFFSLEMSSPQLATRILSAQTEIPLASMRDGNVNDEEMLRITVVMDGLSQTPLIIDDTPNMSVPMMRTRARRLARKHGGIALIVIDYLQLMTSPGGRRNDNRVQELSEITRSLKMLAKELDVPVIALSQLSRAVESRNPPRPMLSDLRESGSIEQDADIVMFTYREEYYLRAKGGDSGDNNPQQQFGAKTNSRKKTIEEVANLAEIIIGKNRHGRTRDVPMIFQGEYTLFKDSPKTGGWQPEAVPGANQNLPAPAPDSINIDDIPDDI